MDEEREFELSQLKDHAIDYYKAKEDGFEGDYESYYSQKWGEGKKGEKDGEFSK